MTTTDERQAADAPAPPQPQLQVVDPLHDCSWSPAFAVGDAVVDAQHSALFALLDNLLHADESGRRGQLVRALRFLTAYVTEHFEVEEALTLAVDFPLLEDHRQEHAQFRSTLGKLKAMLADSVETKALGDAVTAFLLRWVVQHVAGKDQEIGVHLAKLRAAAAKG